MQFRYWNRKTILMEKTGNVCARSVVQLIVQFPIFRFIYCLKGRVREGGVGEREGGTEGKNEREREREISFIGSLLLKCPQWICLCHSEARSEVFIRSPMWVAGHKHLGHLLPSLLHMQEAGSEVEQQGLELVLIQDACDTGNNWTHCATTLDSTVLV